MTSLGARPTVPHGFAPSGTMPFAFRAAPEPLPEEPAHGWVRRAAAMNGQPSMPMFAFRLGLAQPSPDPQTCLALALASDIPNPELLSLNTPVVGDGRVGIRGVEVSVGNWSCRFRRACPACMAQSAHHRFYWDFRFFVTCPFHGLPLEAGTADDPIRWTQTDLRMGAGGSWLPKEAPLLDVPRPSLETYALGRLGVLERGTHTLLDEASLDDGVRAVAVLTTVLAPKDREIGSLPRPCRDAEMREIAFEALSRDRDHLVTRLQERVDAALALLDPRAATSFTALFGRLPPHFYSDERTTGLAGDIRLAMRSVAIGTGRVRYKGAASTPGAERTGALRQRDLVRETGLTIPTAWRLLGYMGLRDPAAGQFTAYHLQEDIDAVRHAVSTAMSPEEVAETLGLLLRDLVPLERAGHLRCFMQRNACGRKTRRFLRSDVDAIVARFASNGEPTVPTVSFHVKRQELCVSRGELARRVVAGELEPAGSLGRGRCFRGMRFAAPSLPEARQPGISVRRAAGILQVPEAIVRWLCETDRLPFAVSTPRFRGISLEATERLAELYIPTSVLAPKLGLASGRLAASHLASRAIEVLRPGPLYVGLVARSDVKALDRSLLERSLADEIWSHLRGACGPGEGSWDLPRSATGNRVWFAITGRKVCATLLIGATLRLELDCTSANAARRWRIVEPLLADLPKRLPGFAATARPEGGVILTSECQAPIGGVPGQEALDWFAGSLAALAREFGTRRAGRPPRSDEAERAESVRRKWSGVALQARRVKARKRAEPGGESRQRSFESS